MIPATAAKWTSRILLVLTLCLFAATFACAIRGFGSTTLGPDGEQVANLTDAETRRITVLMSATGWGVSASLAVRILASSTSLARVLIGLAMPLGLAIMATAPIAATSSSHSDPVGFIAAGIFLVFVSTIVEFAVFRAREAVEAIQEGLEELREARGLGPDAATGVDTGARPPAVPQATFMPQPLEVRSPPPVGEAQPGPAPGGAN